MYEEEATSIGEDQSSSADSDGGASLSDYFACPMDVANVPLAMDRDLVEYEVTPHSMGRTAMPVFHL